MRDALEDIVSRLRHGDYKNEEHVRLAIVCRILSKLGWDIWNPVEVNAEFSAIKNEDASRVDIALFMPPQYIRPAVFIEVKAVGKLLTSIEAAERQLRDYNRNNQAEISVLTDGVVWRFYLASAAGEFSQKCFEKLDLLNEASALDDVELTLDAFLSKTALQEGKAIEEARLYLKRTDAQRIMFEVLPVAQRDAEEDPTRSLVECFVERCSQRGVECSRENASSFVRDVRHRQSTQTTTVQSVYQQFTSQKIFDVDGNRETLENNKSQKDGVLSINGRRGTCASGKNSPLGGFVVFGGSFAAKPSPGLVNDSRGYYPLYRELVNNKILILEERSGVQVYKLICDYKFKSSSAAASIFLGTSASGPREWK